MRKLTSWLLLFAIYISSFAPLALTANGQTVGKTFDTKMKDVPPGLQFHLSEGEEGAEKRVKEVLPPTDPLSAGDAQSLLKRIPEIKPETNDQTDFAKRAGTLPAPKTGKMIPVKFPSDDGRGTPKIDTSNQTLQVIRYSPDGEVKLAPDLNITFSQPMVAVTSQEQAAEYAPVELSPQVEGRWRWLGTKTLMFDTTKRFPMATKFTARVPAGTKSANGQVLQKDFVWNFTTPPPTLEQMIPANQTVRRDALMFVSFDQAINPEAVLRTINVAAGGRRLATRLATQAEVDADGSIGYYAKQAQPGRWLAFRAINADGSTANAMPAASQITVTVEKGTPSAEGPLTTPKAQGYSFQTYSPLKFVRAWCGWQGNTKCTPFQQWYLEFNNQIDSAEFAKELLKIMPSPEEIKIYPSGNYIVVDGYKKGRTTYNITVDGALKDIFGQTLGQAATTTIKVGSADQNLYAQGGTMSVIDPFGTRSYSIYSTNLNSVNVRMYSVQPQDWRQFQQYVMRLNYDDGQRPAIPGRLVSDKVVNIASKADEMVETRIDVSPALNGGFGNVIVDIEPTTKRDKYDRTRIFTWLQSTQIGLDAFVDNTELVGFATELKTGRPLASVDLSIYPNGKTVSEQPSAVSDQQEGVVAQVWNWVTSKVYGPSSDVESTDADGATIDTETVPEARTNVTADNGILRLALPDSPSTKGQNILIAKRGKDIAFLPENSDYYWADSGNWYKKAENDYLRWFVFDDRKMYRPNEEVSVKGYIRKVTAGKLGDIEGLADAAHGFTYSVKDSRDNEIAKGSGNLNAFGAFDFKFKLPDNANLGYTRIDLSTSSNLPGDTYTHQFQIQEFRRPEFEVSTKVQSEAPHLVGGNAMLSVEAKYYAGGGLANAETNWTVTATPTNYTPPNRDDFTFGTWTPWWRVYDYYDGGYGRPYGGGITQTFKGVTDASGKHLLKVDFDSVNPPRPYTITASAAVQDVNRQTWSSSTSLLVHPSTLYVGIRTPRTFVQKGEKIDVESIVTDIDGKMIAGRDAEIKAVLKDWTFDKGTWQEVTVDEQTCTVKSAESAQKCSFAAKQGGRYTITARVMDDRERFNESEITVWVPGGKTPPKRTVEQEEVQIIPGKKEYAPGETAELLVISPFTPAEGVLTLRRDGIVKTERFTMKDSSMTLKIPLEEKYLPNIYAQVDLVGAAERSEEGSADTPARVSAKHEGKRQSLSDSVTTQDSTDKASFAVSGDADKSVRAPRPAFASGNINLPISTDSRKLTVSAEPQDKTLAPGSE
ncbi:MAG TPA: MG2 domain-containing protein, partial [Pyrinomonadaceae bacterium]|nr:MG2 domain-containing protein [Pyrinomonadaceae bacterium]